LKTFINKYLKWILLGILDFVFGLIVHEFFGDKLSSFDTAVYSFIISFKNPFLTFFFKFISYLASPPTLIILSLVMFLAFKNKKYGLLSLISLIFITISNQILKLVFSRERPFNLMMVEEHGYSFPSGHAMVSTAFYGVLIYLIWKTNLNIKYKKMWTIILSILILLIGISRIYLGVHYASDIVAGFTISISYIIILVTLINYYLKSRKWITFLFSVHY